MNDYLENHVINNVVNYIMKNHVYADRESEVLNNTLSLEEMELQEDFEIFVYTILPKAIRLEKYIRDEENSFENYIIFINYNDYILRIFVMYGQGSYFRVDNSNIGFARNLELNLNEIIEIL